MANVNIENILYSQQVDAQCFKWDSLTAPNLYSYIHPYAINEIYKIVKSIKYDSKFSEKVKIIDEIMSRFGFVHMAMGTNRAIYRHLEDTSIVAKVVISRAALNDNIDEYRNQFLFIPFVTKVFQVSEYGVVGLVERVEPITNIMEFLSVAKNVFELLTNRILGKYVLEDIGTESYMNYGVRVGFGPVLLDFPYVFELDSNKLFCNNHIQGSDVVCNGQIDYDDGFDNLICSKCKKVYQARELKKQITDKTIILGTDNNSIIQKAKIIRGDKKARESISSTSFIVSKDEYNSIIGVNKEITKDKLIAKARIIRGQGGTDNV